MKKFILSILTLLFITFYSCDREEMYDNSDYIEDLDLDDDDDDGDNDDDDDDDNK